MNSFRKILIAGSAAAAVSAIATAALAADNTANTSVGIDAKVIAPITISAGTNLNFGTAFTNAATKTVILDAENNRSGTASVLASSTTSAATFTVGGTDAQLFDVAYVTGGLPSGITVGSFTTTGCGKTDSASLTGYTTSSSTCTLNVGGTLTIAGGTAAQTVSGTLTTTVTYE